MFFSSVFCCCQAAKLFRRNHSRNSGLVPTYFTHYDITARYTDLAPCCWRSLMVPRVLGESHIFIPPLSNIHQLWDHSSCLPTSWSCNNIIDVEVRRGNKRHNNICNGHKVISEIAECRVTDSLCCIADITHIISPSLDIMIRNTNTIISYVATATKELTF